MVCQNLVYVEDSQYLNNVLIAYFQLSSHKLTDYLSSCGFFPCNYCLFSVMKSSQFSFSNLAHTSLISLYDISNSKQPYRTALVFNYQQMRPHGTIYSMSYLLAGYREITEFMINKYTPSYDCGLHTNSHNLAPPCTRIPRIFSFCEVSFVKYYFYLDFPGYVIHLKEMESTNGCK